MAGSKRTAVVARNLSSAAELLHECATEIYALDDIARGLPKSPYTALTTLCIVTRITGSIAGRLDRALKLLPEPHKAWLRCDAALHTIEDLNDAIKAFVGDDEYKVEDQTVGAVLYDLTVRAAKDVERAELACGSRLPGTDYLNSTSDPNRAMPS